MWEKSNSIGGKAPSDYVSVVLEIKLLRTSLLAVSTSIYIPALWATSMASTVDADMARE